MSENQSKGDNNKLSEEHYRTERKLLIELESQSARSFDKAMITLPGGALALSMAFVKEIAPQMRWPCLLASAWISFLGALLSILVSFLFSQWALREEQIIIRDDFTGKRPMDSRKNRWSRATGYLNVFSIGTFVLGVLLLAVFCIKNLPQ